MGILSTFSLSRTMRQFHDGVHEAFRCLPVSAVNRTRWGPHAGQGDLLHFHANHRMPSFPVAVSVARRVRMVMNIFHFHRTIEMEEKFLIRSLYHVGYSEKLFTDMQNETLVSKQY